MVKNYFLTPFLFAIVAITTAGSAQPTIYLVRHAEKQPTWHGEELDDFHPLSEQGILRAKNLAGQFEKGSLSAIFSSRATRTLHTALPLAEKLRLTVQLSAACWDTTAIDSFYAELKKNFKPGQAVLLVTHSNIIPYLLMRAGLPKACRSKAGITVAPDGSGWLVIEGYDNIWRIEKLGATGKNCEAFSRQKMQK
jgi:broad specificity phosphatase PhoE